MSSFEDFTRNLALAMGVVFFVVLLASVPRLMRLRGELESPPKVNWRVLLLSLSLVLAIRLIDWLNG